MRSVAKGVREIRIRHEGQYRLIYLLVREEAVYVLHVFHKKTQRTPAAVVRVARQRLADLTRRRVCG